MIEAAAAVTLDACPFAVDPDADADACIVGRHASETGGRRDCCCCRVDACENDDGALAECWSEGQLNDRVLDEWRGRGRTGRSATGGYASSPED